MVRRSLIPALVILLLLLVGATNAQAAEYQITFEPAVPVTGDQVTFHAKRVNPGNGGQNDVFIWDFGDGGTDTGRNPPAHVYSEARTYTVNLIVTNDAGTELETATLDIAVGPNAPPSAAFSVLTASPVAGEPVSFAGGSDPDGDSVTREWAFGDGTTGTGPTPSHTYANAGDYTVTLTVSDGHGAFDTSSQTVTVAERPAGSPPPGDGGTQTFNQLGGSGSPTSPLVPTPNAPAPAIMRPFPVVRIAGVVLPRGARVRILSVRGPRGMQVRVRCRGRGCPLRSMGLTSATRVARLHRFERRLAAGTTLELFVRKPGKIGKYTRFLIRAGAPPKRVDLCLFPKRRSPGRCP